MEQTLVKPIARAENFVIKGQLKPGYEKVLTPAALEFLTELHRLFNARRIALLEARQERQLKINDRQFLTSYETSSPFRDADWKADPVPACLQDRRVEITGPV